MARRPHSQAQRPIDLFDYRQDPGSVSPRRITPADAPIGVTDDWKSSVPVTDHEARVIEAFFADLLDELFGPIP
ncbi:MAG: hypothetical protein K0Q62_664 [Phenylobacterium sp.]|jgi:hypothetical protein|nr:hypothetical protein [Phenylobacterium sp.]